LNNKFSQSNVATCSRYVGIFNDSPYITFTAESHGEKVFLIGQNLPNLWARFRVANHPIFLGKHISELHTINYGVQAYHKIQFFLIYVNDICYINAICNVFCKANTVVWQLSNWFAAKNLVLVLTKLAILSLNAFLMKFALTTL